MPPELVFKFFIGKYYDMYHVHQYDHNHHLIILMFRHFTFNSNLSGSHVFDKDETKKKYSHQIASFGQKVEWLDGRHYAEEDLEKYRLVGDTEMDRMLDLNAGKNEICGEFAHTIEACKNIYHERHDVDRREDTDVLDVSVEQQAMYDFYRHYHDFVPSWVDWDQIQRGIDIFITYSPVAGQALYYLSLVPGFSIPKIAKVLEQTRYLVPPSTPTQVRNRLMDTGGFVSNAMLPNKSGLSAASLRPGCKAWKMALQVRTLHAKVRRSILRNKRINWDIEKYGVPINQEDMAATLLAFSVNVLMGVEFVSGRPLSVDAQKDYLALWRYIGWLLGIESDERDSNFQSFEHAICSNLEPLDPCGTRLSVHDRDNSIIHARASLESFIIHLMNPNKSSSIIAKHLLSIGGSSENKGAKEKDPKEKDNLGYLYRCFMCRRFIGDTLADSLEIPKPTFRSKSMLAYMCTTGVLMILRLYTLSTMKSSWFRKRAYSRHLKLIKRFDEVWSKNNSQRMQRPTRNIEERKSSSCAFHLVMPPKASDSYHPKND